MEVTAAMRSMGSIRELTDEPVSHEVLHRILDAARFAGSGGNRQGWHVTVIESVEARAEITRLSRIGFLEYAAQVAAGLVPFAPGDDGRWHGAPVDLAAARQKSLDNPFLDVLERAPVVLLVSVDLRTLAITDVDAEHVSIIGGASIYPFVQNILLAARDERLGGVLTTFVCRAESEVRAFFRMPPSHTIAALLMLGYPPKHPTKLTRKPVEQFATIDRFDGAPFTAP